MRTGRVALVLDPAVASDPETINRELTAMIGPDYELLGEVVMWLRRDESGEVLHVECNVISP